MALDRIDAIVIGATNECLVAAAFLARAGRYVLVLDRRKESDGQAIGIDAVVDVPTVLALDLKSHGLRLGAAPPTIGIEEGRSLILWPEMSAARDSIAAHSARDASALEAFCARLLRGHAVVQQWPADGLVSSLTMGRLADSALRDAHYLRAAALDTILNEAFDNHLLKGLWAQSAIADTAVSPSSPGSARLLLRAEILARIGNSRKNRFVVGGAKALNHSLLTALKFYNTVDIHFTSEVKQVLTERDAVQGVTMADGLVHRAPVVFCASEKMLRDQFLPGMRKPLPSSFLANPSARQAQIVFDLKGLPKIFGVDMATATSGAIIRFAPSLDSLIQAHAAYRLQSMPDGAGMEIRIFPQMENDEVKTWKVSACLPYLPPATADGPWAGNRREKLAAVFIKTIERFLPGFAGLIEGVNIVWPQEAMTVMDGRGTPALSQTGAHELARAPAVDVSGAKQMFKGLVALRPNVHLASVAAGRLGAEISGVVLPETKANANA